LIHGRSGIDAAFGFDYDQVGGFESSGNVATENAIGDVFDRKGGILGAEGDL
jgi:hypothetical protein